MSAPAAAVFEEPPFQTIVRNVTTRYLSVAVEMVLGLVTLPFNLHHLGPDAYGLWMLTAGATIHFSILDLGYGGAMVKFIAQYRAHGHTRALNEIASTLFYLFLAFGIVAYLVVIGLAFNLEHVFKLTAGQAEIGKWILLIIGVNVSLNFPFSIYGGIVGGFQRYDVNNNIAIVSSIAVAAVNIGVVLLGYGLLPLVAATTSVRVLTYFLYRRTAFRVFPSLELRLRFFRRERLRELTGFSVYSSIVDWANKLNYELDDVVIGVFLGAAPVAVWAVADRIVSAIQRLTNQANAVLFPVVVDSDARQSTDRLQRLLIEGTRLSLASVLPMALVAYVMADSIVRAWVGPKMLGAAPVIQILAVTVALRVGNATSTTLLKGAGRVRDVAYVNIVTGLVNLALSATLIHWWGLPGVALGTLLPVACASVFVLFPMACRRVGLGVGIAFRQAVWPLFWPAIAAGIALETVRAALPDSVVALFAEAAFAAVVYLALAVYAIGRLDRARYLTKLAELRGRKRHLVPAT